VSDSETGASASSLARESESEAPAWLAKRSPALLPFVSIGVIGGSNDFVIHDFVNLQPFYSSRQAGKVNARIG
jgi:hypothetical protein